MFDTNPQSLLQSHLGHALLGELLPFRPRNEVLSSMHEGVEITHHMLEGHLPSDLSESCTVNYASIRAHATAQVNTDLIQDKCRRSNPQSSEVEKTTSVIMHAQERWNAEHEDAPSATCQQA